MSNSEGLTSPMQLTPAQIKAKAELVEAGNAAFDADDFEKALDMYHRASMIDGNDSAVWQALGLTYYNLEFPQEAWRSYKLALHADPDNLDAMWYAGEFLFNMDDLEMSRIVLKRYIDLETDISKKAEAEEMFNEASRQLGIEDQSPEDVLLFSDPESDMGEDESEDVLEGFEYEDEGSASEFDDDDDFDDDLIREGEEDLFAKDEEEFVASLALELTGMKGKCTHCNTPIPADAPYCYSCKAPHFYEDG